MVSRFKFILQPGIKWERMILPVKEGKSSTAVLPPKLYAWMQRDEALLNDPSVYDGIQALLGGANRSWLLRWVV